MSEVQKKKGVSYHRKDGAPVYRKSIRINGVIFSETFSRKTDSDRWYMEKKREKELVDRGIKPMTLNFKKLKEYAAEWMTLRKTQNPISTWKTELERLNLFVLPEFGERPMHQISTVEWKTFLNSLVTKHERTTSTRNRYRTLLHKIYEDAILDECVQVNPISRIPIWKENKEPFKYFETGEECRKYLEVGFQTGRAIYLYGMIALNTGARLGEILALRNRDIDLTKREMRICRIVENVTYLIKNRTKSGDGVERRIGISDSLHELMSKHLKTPGHSKPDDLLISNGDGSVFSESSLRKMHHRVLKLGELMTLRIHDLRHTYGSHFMMNGGNIYDLKDIMGHADVRTTMRYAHLGRNHLVSKANVVSLSEAKPECINDSRLRIISVK